MSPLFQMSQQLADWHWGLIVAHFALKHSCGERRGMEVTQIINETSNVQRGSGHKLRKKKRIKFHLNTRRSFDRRCAQTRQQAALIGGKVTLQILKTRWVTVLGSSAWPCQGRGGWAGWSPDVVFNPTPSVKASLIFGCILLLLLWNAWGIITNAPAGHLSHKCCCCVITAALIV